MAEKPPKPPVWKHPCGLWAKKHRGHVYYFGSGSLEDALRRYLAEWPDIVEGRGRPEKMVPRGDAGDVTVAYLCNAYLARKRERVNTGELAEASWARIRQMAARVIASLGRHRRVIDLGPPDFARVRADAAAAFPSPRTLRLFIGLARGLFRFGAELVDRVPKYGDAFAMPPARVVRLHRHAKGERLIPVAGLRTLVEAADPAGRAAVLLGLNCAFGSTDLSELRQSHLEKRPGWVELPRRKTGIARRCPLWPETVAALEAAWRVRPRPADPADADRLFLTRTGLPLVRWARGRGAKAGGGVDGASKAFARLCGRAGVPLPKGSGLYILRHVFRTVADEVPDRPAVELIMGHTRKDMGGSYVEKVADSRLEAVVGHVRKWLFGTPAEKGRGKKTRKK